MQVRTELEFQRFTGFPEPGLKFLRRLKKNNNRDWFKAHRSEFEESLLRPMQSLVAELRDILAPIAPSVRIDPKKSIFRIYRDIRFSQDKSPYKTHLAASFDNGAVSRAETPCFYLHIAPDEVLTAGGIYMPSSDQLRAIRQAIAADAPTFLRLVEDRHIKRTFGELQGEKLQRTPLGFSKDHPMLRYLQFKQLYFGRSYEVSACHKPAFVHQVADDFIRLLPFVDWLTRGLEPERGRERN